MDRYIILLLTLPGLALLPADGPAPKSPLSPDAEKATFHLAPGLRIDLIAAEPQVESPVACAFDEAGKLWVVEMLDYPNGPPKGQPGQGRIATQLLVHGISGDREPRPGNVFFGQVLQRLLKLAAPLRIRSRDPLPGWTGLPDAQQPDPVEAHVCQAIQLGVRNVIKCRRSAEAARQLGQPDAGIDLVQHRIAG